MDQETLWQGLHNAWALVFPVKWSEPFGTATAMGTPVGMCDRGPAREQIVDWEDGFVVAPDNLREMVTAVERVGQIDRPHYAAHARGRFHIAISVQQYLDLYQLLLP